VLRPVNRHWPTRHRRYLCVTVKRQGETSPHRHSCNAQPFFFGSTDWLLPVISPPAKWTATWTAALQTGLMQSSPLFKLTQLMVARSAALLFTVPMPEPTKWARYRARLAGTLPAVPMCPTCGKQIRGAGRDGLCSRCWALTAAGRADLRERVARSRSRRRQATPEQ
jgi:hypothetical protein